MTLSGNNPTRKQRFDAALDLAGLTQETWRKEVFQVSGFHLREVLAGVRPASPDLDAAINGLIETYLVPVERAVA